MARLLSRLEVKVVPSHEFPDINEFIVDVEVGLNPYYHYTQTYTDDCFKSEFDQAWAVAKKEIERFVKNGQV